MRTLLAATLLIALTASGWAQSDKPSPAQMGIERATVPEVVYVLDSTKTWVRDWDY